MSNEEDFDNGREPADAKETELSWDTLSQTSSASNSKESSDHSSSQNKILIIGGGILVFLVFIWWIGSANIDLPWKMGSKVGRAKNAISALVGGTIAYELARQENREVVIDLDVEKGWWPDAEVLGHASSSSINAKVNLWFTSATYTAQANSSGQVEGRVDKSEYDWKIKSLKPNVYQVGRFAMKLDQQLELVVADGKITGRINVSVGRDYVIDGTYDPKTHAVDVTVKRNVSTVKFKLKGTVSPK